MAESIQPTENRYYGLRIEQKASILVCPSMNDIRQRRRNRERANKMTDKKQRKKAGQNFFGTERKELPRFGSTCSNPRIRVERALRLLGTEQRKPRSANGLPGSRTVGSHPSPCIHWRALRISEERHRGEFVDIEHFCAVLMARPRSCAGHQRRQERVLKSEVENRARAKGESNPLPTHASTPPWSSNAGCRYLECEILPFCRTGGVSSICVVPCPRGRKLAMLARTSFPV